MTWWICFIGECALLRVQCSPHIAWRLVGIMSLKPYVSYTAWMFAGVQMLAGYRHTAWFHQWNSCCTRMCDKNLDSFITVLSLTPWMMGMAIPPQPFTPGSPGSCTTVEPKLTPSGTPWLWADIMIRNRKWGAETGGPRAFTLNSGTLTNPNPRKT